MLETNRLQLEVVDVAARFAIGSGNSAPAYYGVGARCFRAGTTEIRPFWPSRGAVGRTLPGISESSQLRSGIAVGPL
jgi:hypothetical protein